MTCTACGGTNLVDGSLVGGDEQPVSFVFAGRTLWRKILGIGNREVLAFACIHCGNVQHQVQFTDQDRERFASYDGPPPSVIADLGGTGDE